MRGDVTGVREQLGGIAAKCDFDDPALASAMLLPSAAKSTISNPLPAEKVITGPIRDKLGSFTNVLRNERLRPPRFRGTDDGLHRGLLFPSVVQSVG